MKELKEKQKYKGKDFYGISILKEKLFLYVNCKNNIEDWIIDAKNIKKLEYNDGNSSNKNSNYSISSTSSKEKVKDEELYYNYYYIEGKNKENHWNFFFENLYKLIHLPNLLFTIKPQNFIKTNSNKNNNETFLDYSKRLFRNFIETDSAYFNPNEEVLKPNYIPHKSCYDCYKIIKVYKNNDNEFKIEILENNDLTIKECSLIISETKLSVPEAIFDINDNEKIDKINFQKSLYFILFKLILKIDYYSELLKNEFLSENTSIKNNQLFLVFNHRPIINFENDLQTTLGNLIKNKKIQVPFYLQAIYISPNIETYNLKMIKDNLEKTIEEQKEEMEKQKEEMKKQKEEIEKQKEEMKKQKEEMKKENEKILKEQKEEMEKQKRK